MKSSYRNVNPSNKTNFRVNKIPILILASTLLACALFPPAADEYIINIRQRLATLTPTPNQISNQADPAASDSAVTPTSVATTPAQPAGTPTQTPRPATVSSRFFTPTPSATPSPTSPPTPTPTPTVDGFALAPISTETDASWSLDKIYIETDSDTAVVRVYGELLNNTSAAQELAFVTGTFFDAQGQVVADEADITDFWPADVIPPGGRMPFELMVDSAEPIASYDLRVEARPSQEQLRQDFDFLEQYQQTEEESYCVGGTLRNPGGNLQNYLLITALLYNQQGQLLGFGEAYEVPLTGGESLDFEICLEPPAGPVSRYQLQAWGQ